MRKLINIHIDLNNKNTILENSGYIDLNGKSCAMNPPKLLASLEYTTISRGDRYEISHKSLGGEPNIPKMKLDTQFLDNVVLRDVCDNINAKVPCELTWDSKLRIATFKFKIMPLNDYKTLAKSNLVGTGASKSYITLAQLKSFKFEYNRQTYINKLAGYIANDFQGVVSNVTAYLNEIQNQLDYLNNEFNSISDQDIVSNFNYYIEKYGIGKCDESVLMFMAITAQESLYGKRIAETWDTTLGYDYNQRGGGYSQLTGITKTNQTGNHVQFMTSIGYSNNEISTILDLPFHIATYLPMSSSCYAWTKGNAISCDITTDIIEYGIKKGAEMKLVYLVVSYAINGGYKKSTLQTLLDRKIFSEPSSPPNGWTDRKNSFNKAISIFSNGLSIFKAF